MLKFKAVNVKPKTKSSKKVKKKKKLCLAADLVTLCGKFQVSLDGNIASVRWGFWAFLIKVYVKLHPRISV